MALNFTTTITTPQGIEVSNAYGRVSVQDSVSGTTIQAGLEIYVSEAAFLNGAEALPLPNLSYAQAAYDRTTDGTDILDLAHDLLVSELAKVGISATKSL